MKKIIGGLILAFLLLAPQGFSADADTVYLVDVRTSVRYELDDPDSTQCFWTNTILNDFINQGLRDVAGMGCIIKLDTVITSANTLMYSLASDFIDAVGVIIEIGGEWQSMQYRALRTFEKGEKSLGKDADRANPSFYNIQNQTLLIDPIGSGSDSMIVFYQAYANDLTGDSIIVDVPYEYQRLVVLGALKRALLMNRENETYSLMAQAVDKEYQEKYSRLFRKSEPDALQTIR